MIEVTFLDFLHTGLEEIEFLDFFQGQPAGKTNRQRKHKERQSENEGIGDHDQNDSYGCRTGMIDVFDKDEQFFKNDIGQGMAQKSPVLQVLNHGQDQQQTHGGDDKGDRENKFEELHLLQCYQRTYFSNNQQGAQQQIYIIVNPIQGIEINLVFPGTPTADPQQIKKGQEKSHDQPADLPQTVIHKGFVLFPFGYTGI